MNLKIILPIAFIGGVLIGGFGIWLYEKNQERHPAKDHTSSIQDEIKILRQETDDYFEG